MLHLRKDFTRPDIKSKSTKHMMFFDVLCCGQGLCLLWSFQLVILPGSSVYIALPHVMGGGVGVAVGCTETASD